MIFFCFPGEDPDLTQIIDPHAVTGVVKAYLRELPEPPLTFDLFPVFVSALSAPANSEARLRYYRIAVKALPRINFLVLRRLFGFLSVLTKTAEFTKMHSQVKVFLISSLLLLLLLFLFFFFFGNDRPSFSPPLPFPLSLSPFLLLRIWPQCSVPI